MKTNFNKMVIAGSLFLLTLVGTVKAEGKETTVKLNTVEVKEQALELENWMVDQDKWEANRKSNDFIVDRECTNEVSNWMINSKNWKNSQTIDLQNEKDQSLKIKNWMIAPFTKNKQ